MNILWEILRVNAKAHRREIYRRPRPEAKAKAKGIAKAKAVEKAKAGL